VAFPFFAKIRKKCDFFCKNTLAKVPENSIIGVVPERDGRKRNAESEEPSKPRSRDSDPRDC
jgi:hypothetical protein